MSRRFFVHNRKLFLVPIVIMIVVCNILLCSCTETEKLVAVEKANFRTFVPGEEKTHQEMLYFSEIKYNSKIYTATVCGEILQAENSNYVVYNIGSQNVSFTQVYGNIWTTSITASDNTTITIYARRAGENIIGNGNLKDIDCSGYIETAWEYEIYKDINYITCFGFTYTYFPYGD